MSRFQKWATATTVATLLLIMVGGLVRASDAGLGCPDWPTCFGQPYPPFTYAEFLERDVPADFDAENFTVRLAWIEYLNRLTGAVIGLLVVITLASAWVDHRHNKHIFYPTLGAFITVLLNGWLGSQVIESRLDPIVISLHLLLAWLQMSLLLYATVSAYYPDGGMPKGELPAGRKTLARMALGVLAITLIQAGMGADLRGQLENIEKDNPSLERGEWIGEADFIDQIHRSFSWVVLAGIFWMGWYAHTRIDRNDYLRYGTQLTGLLAIIQVGVGIGLAYVSLPPPLQVIHLINGTLLIASITLVYLLATRLPIAETAPESVAAPATAQPAMD